MHLALDDTIFLNLEGTAEVDRTPADFSTNSGAQIYVHHREVSYRHAAKARQGGLWVACVASVSVRKNLEREQKTVSSSFLVLFSYQLSRINSSGNASLWKRSSITT